MKKERVEMGRLNVERTKKDELKSKLSFGLSEAKRMVKPQSSREHEKMGTAWVRGPLAGARFQHFGKASPSRQGSQG